MPPAGRPRRAANRDLPPGLLRRERRGRVRYYYQAPDGTQTALGTDLAEALARWHDLHTTARTLITAMEGEGFLIAGDDGQHRTRATVAWPFPRGA